MADKPQYQRVGDLVPMEDVRPEYLKMDDWPEHDFLIRGVEYKEGTMGRYALIHVTDMESGEEAVFSSGGEIVLAQLAVLEETNKLPAVAEFAKSGRTNYMK